MLKEVRHSGIGSEGQADMENKELLSLFRKYRIGSHMIRVRSIKY